MLDTSNRKSRVITTTSWWSGCGRLVLAAELSASGAQVLVIESGDPTTHRPS